VNDVLPCAGKEIVNAQDFVTLLKKPVAQVRAQEARAAGDEDTP